MTDSHDEKSLFTEFIDDFYSESDEHMTAVQKNILTLETFIGKPKVDYFLIESLFRSFHTLKGLSGMMGIKASESLSHKIENYLKTYRDKPIPITLQALNVLADGSNMLSRVIAAHKDQQPCPDTTLIEASLSDMLSQAPAVTEPALPKDEVQTVFDTDKVALSLKPDESHNLSEAARAGKSLWLFDFKPSTSLSERGVNVNSTRSRFLEIGEVIHASPRITAESGIAFSFIVATTQPESDFSDWKDDGMSWSPYEASAVSPIVPVIEDVHAISSGQASSIAPSNVVRVDLSRLNELMRLVGELVISRARLDDNLGRLEKIVPQASLRPLQETNLGIERQLRDLRESVMRVRMVPIGEVFERMRFVIRDLSRENQKKVNLELKGQETEIDKFLVERIMDPLLHLVRNAVSHGLEPCEERLQLGKPAEGKITLKASAAGDLVVIEIRDDGRGLDRNRIAERAKFLGILDEGAFPDERVLLDILCASGFSTRDEADLISGRGVGMTVVKDAIRKLGGSLEMDSEAGKGTRFTIRLPLTLAIADAFIVAVGEQTFAIPQSLINEVIEIDPSTVTRMEKNEIIPYRNGVLPLQRLSRMFGLSQSHGRNFFGLIIGSGLGAVVITVDRIIGRREIVVRAITDPLLHVPGISGATELGDGRVVLILDSSVVRGQVRSQ